VSFSSPSEIARSTSIVCSRMSRHWSASASPGLSPAYARTLISVASRGELAARIRSIVAGASGRTSWRRGSDAFRTARAGFDEIWPFSNARWRIAPRRVSA